MALFLACTASPFFPECNVGLVKDTIHVSFSLNKGSVRSYTAISVTIIVAVSRGIITAVVVVAVISVALGAATPVIVSTATSVALRITTTIVVVAISSVALWTVVVVIRAVVILGGR